MNKVKVFLKDNIFLVIIFVLVVGTFIGFTIYNQINNSKEYEKKVTESDMVDVDYIKKNYKVNEYQNVTIDYIDILDEYHSYFVRKMVNDPDKAFAMLTDESKKMFNNSIEEFKKYIKENATVSFKNSKVKEYRTNNKKNKIEIIDTDNNKYTIFENAVWDIKISIDGKR